MKLFAARPELSLVEQAGAILAKAQEKHARLVLQLRDAERNLGECKSAAAAAALAENADLAADLADDVANVVARHEALEHAVGLANAELHQAEQALAHEQHLELRAASVHELRGLIDQIEAAAQRFGPALADLLTPLRKAAEVSHDVKASCGFVELLQSDMPQMISNATHALELYARNIELGSAPARLPRPAPTPLAVSAPPPPTRSIMPIFDISFTDSAGQQRHGPKHWDIGLPVI
jgi:NADH dehydrogenase/NADH:ubiquinone oxidoreductase subunit G